MIRFEVFNGSSLKKNPAVEKWKTLIKMLFSSQNKKKIVLALEF